MSVANLGNSLQHFRPQSKPQRMGVMEGMGLGLG